MDDFIDKFEELPEDDFEIAVNKLEDIFAKNNPNYKKKYMTESERNKFRESLQKMIKERWGKLSNTSRNCPNL
jgi:hypothetical protein